jgi:iron complex transport system ATP-binding protein
MLAAHALDFGYPGRTVGRALDLALKAGEVICVLGPNGAGKSTLFRTLLGLLPPLGGKVTLSGRDAASLPRAEFARAVAYVPQAASGDFDFTLQEHVEMGRVAHLGVFAKPGRADRDIAAQALERLGIAALAGRPVSALSGGERQLGLIARALASEANALVMDEPTANLDFGNQVRVLEEIARLRASGIAILFCAHDPDHAFEVADRVLLLDQGKALAFGATAEVLTASNLSALYRVEVSVVDIATDSGARRACIRK